MWAESLRLGNEDYGGNKVGEEGGDEADRDTGDPEKARSVFERGYEDLKGREWTDRVALLEAWKAYEQEHGSSEQVALVQSLMPQATKRRRKINDAGDMEEYWDMIFADDEKKANPAGFKFLQMAHAWKQNQVTGGAGAASLPSLPGFVKPASAMPYNGDGGNLYGGRSEKGSDESEDE